MKLILLFFLSVSLFAVPVPETGWTRDGEGFITTVIAQEDRLPDFQTTDATQGTLYTETMDDDSVLFIETKCNARGSAREAFKLAAIFYRTGGGAATLEGSVVVIFNQDGSPYALTMDTSSNDFRVRATGQAADTVTWKCSLRREVLK